MKEQTVPGGCGGTLVHPHTEADLLVVCSDHGNIERPTTKSHTRNPVPLVALGPGASAFFEAASLLDVTPALVSALAG